MLQTTFLQQCPLSAFPHSFASSSSSSAKSTVYSCSSVKVKVYACCQTSSAPMSVVNGNADARVPQRSEIRLGLPSKGRMASDTIDLLKVSLYLSRSLSLSVSLSLTHTRAPDVWFFVFLILWLRVWFLGLSIVCQASESSAIRCANTSGLCSCTLLQFFYSTIWGLISQTF